MKTKEQILNDQWEKLYVVGTGDIKPPTFAAMDEYAKQQAIAFIKFKDDYIERDKERHFMNQTEFGLQYPKWESPSLQDIYDLFIETQQNNG